MAIKRIVDTKFWTDPKVIDQYSVEDKYFMLYLLTNPHTTQLGIYQLPKRLISFETGYTAEVVEVLIQRFRDTYGNILYSNESQEVAVLNSLKYSIVKGGKPVEDLLTKEISKIEDVSLIEGVYNNMIGFWGKSVRAFDDTVKEIFEEEIFKRKEAKENNVNDNVNDNDNDNEESYPDSYNDSSTSIDDRFEILWKLYPNKKGKKKALTHYRAALKDGVTDDEIEKGIKNYVAYCKKERTSQKFIKHGDTYFNQRAWEDEYEIKTRSSNYDTSEYDDLY